jgi:hypothetical protein
MVMRSKESQGAHHGQEVESAIGREGRWVKAHTDRPRLKGVGTPDDGPDRVPGRGQALVSGCVRVRVRRASKFILRAGCDGEME